jgi:hypothetical protein
MDGFFSKVFTVLNKPELATRATQIAADAWIDALHVLDGYLIERRQDKTAKAWEALLDDFVSKELVPEPARHRLDKEMAEHLDAIFRAKEAADSKEQQGGAATGAASSGSAAEQMMKTKQPPSSGAAPPWSVPSQTDLLAEKSSALTIRVGVGFKAFAAVNRANIYRFNPSVGNQARERMLNEQWAQYKEPSELLFQIQKKEGVGSRTRVLLQGKVRDGRAADASNACDAAAAQRLREELVLVEEQASSAMETAVADREAARKPQRIRDFELLPRHGTKEGTMYRDNPSAFYIKHGVQRGLESSDATRVQQLDRVSVGLQAVTAAVQPLKAQLDSFLSKVEAVKKARDQAAQQASGEKAAQSAGGTEADVPAAPQRADADGVEAFQPVDLTSPWSSALEGSHGKAQVEAEAAEPTVGEEMAAEMAWREAEAAVEAEAMPLPAVSLEARIAAARSRILKKQQLKTASAPRRLRPCVPATPETGPPVTSAPPKQPTSRLAPMALETPTAQRKRGAGDGLCSGDVLLDFMFVPSRQSGQKNDPVDCVSSPAMVDGKAVQPSKKAREIILVYASIDVDTVQYESLRPGRMLGDDIFNVLWRKAMETAPATSDAVRRVCLDSYNFRKLEKVGHGATPHRFPSTPSHL